MTLLGLLISGVLGIARIFTKKIKFEKYYWVYDIKVGPDYWGGFDCGLNFLRDQKSPEAYLNTHEFGHAIAQNTLFGPFFIFLIAIPSAARWWYQEIRERKGKSNKPYDSIWFEDSASQCGEYAIAYIKAKSDEKVAK